MERRADSQVKQLNKDLGRLHTFLEGKKMKKKHQDNLQNNKTIEVKTANINIHQKRLRQFQ